MDSICPQDDAGGRTPTPRKDSPASEIMLEGSSSAAYVTSGAETPGRISRSAMRVREAPDRRAADT